MASASIDGLMLIIHPTDFANVTKRLTMTAVKTTFTETSLELKSAIFHSIYLEIE